MHALWDIPELVQMIFGLTDKRTLRELAQVCRSFWLQALPFLWRSVRDLRPLLRLLPEDSVLRRSDGAINMGLFTVTRALDESDWDRFILHSQHIRQFYFRLWQQHVLLELEPHLPSTPIMQNLSSVRFDMRWKLEVDLELLGRFLPPSVTNVDVCAIGQSEDAQRFLNGLATEMKLPRLKSFSITVGSQPEKDLGSSVSHVLRSHPAIERLKVDIGNSHEIHEVLRQAGQLPKLRHFTMSIYDGTDLSLDHDSFPVLESLKLSSSSHGLDALLVWLPSEKIRRLDVKVEDPLPASQDVSGTSLADSFRTVGTFTHLEVLKVWLEVVVTWETMQHILGCKELQTFMMTLWHGSKPKLQESHLEQMARAWPRLKTLRLQLHDSPSHGTTYLELNYLRVIATEFRNLRRLSMTFDAMAASSSRFSPSDLTVPAQYSLQELDVETSLIDKEGVKVIAGLLASWWPNILEIKWQYAEPHSHWSAVQESYRSCIA